VYWSLVGSWSTSASVGLSIDEILSLSRGAHVGDRIYFKLRMGPRILKYDLVKHHLSVIEPPESCGMSIFIVPTEDGLLGVAGVRGSSLYLWSRKANAGGVEGWTRYRVIELRTLLPADSLRKTPMVVGFAEDVRVIFVHTVVGHFAIDLSSE